MESFRPHRPRKKCKERKREIHPQLRLLEMFSSGYNPVPETRSLKVFSHPQSGKVAVAVKCVGCRKSHLNLCRRQISQWVVSKTTREFKSSIPWGRIKKSVSGHLDRRKCQMSILRVARWLRWVTFKLAISVLWHEVNAISSISLTPPKWTKGWSGW